MKKWSRAHLPPRELDMATVVCTRGRDFPLARLAGKFRPSATAATDEFDRRKVAITIEFG
jgi:hypothetical protein